MTIAALIIALIAFTVSAFTLGYVIARPWPDAPHHAEPSAPAQTAANSPEIAELRRKLEQEAKAFQELMNYNADVAYGINTEDSDE